VIKKPVICQAVKRIDRYITRSYNKGEMTSEQATQLMNKVLDVAFTVLTIDSKKFEAEIESLDNDSEKLDLFINRVRLNY
jgi:hypothetical protein